MKQMICLLFIILTALSCNETKQSGGSDSVKGSAIAKNENPKYDILQQWKNEDNERYSLLAYKYELEPDTVRNVILGYRGSGGKLSALLEGTEIKKIDKLTVGELSKKYRLSPKIIASMLIDDKTLNTDVCETTSIQD